MSSHEVGATARARGPGHMMNSPNSESKSLLPCSSVRSPLEAGVQEAFLVPVVIVIVIIDVLSAAEKPSAIHAVIVSAVWECG